MQANLQHYKFVVQFRYVNDFVQNIPSKVYYGLPKTRGVSKTGHAGSGTVVHFGTLQHTMYPYCGVAGIHRYISKVISIF